MSVVVLHMPTSSPRALRSCITHRRHSINTGFENAIEKEIAGRKQTVSVLYKVRLVFRDTIQNGSFSCIWTTCVPLFNEKAAAVAMIRHGMHGHTA